MTQTTDLEQRLRALASREDCMGVPLPIMAELARLRAENAELRQSVIAFGAPWAVRYAEDAGFAPGELHPVHYDILAKAGGRMDQFRPAALKGSSHE